MAIMERSTRQRTAIRETLAEAGRPLSPQEILTAAHAQVPGLGIATVYPENQAAGIAARGAGTRMCEEAESEGYSNDICAYARVSLAYAKLKSCPEQDVPMPDVLLCCSNICSCMI